MRRLVAGLIVVLTACGPDKAPAPGPADRVESLFRAYESGDCTQAKSLVTRPDDLPCEQVDSIARLFETGRLSLEDATFTVTDEGGESAAVDVDLGDGEGPAPYDVVKIDGEWLVELDTSA
ncbi:hypothetical protein ASD11_11405 [Aeromicrobium sp. Root495]|uniref:hypothetical protein n=1 Tax=Aeromicrobium sp. Root495 TaxID=1736550 RepID=UPI0006FDDAC6|nr:hypothetical protein [Aeromicrobium sp. Root495]KQY60094.1 hypothetical protein ASD11_11405 [Aeromicrobium sp. Root495]